MPPRSGGPQPGASWNNLSRISEFKVSADRNRADMNSEKVLLEWDDPPARIERTIKESIRQRHRVVRAQPS